jgi:hypothetical protein
MGEWVRSIGEMVRIGEYSSTRRLPCPIATSSITYLALACLESQTGLRGERPPTNRKSHDMVNVNENQIYGYLLY